MIWIISTTQKTLKKNSLYKNDNRKEGGDIYSILPSF